MHDDEQEWEEVFRTPGQVEAELMKGLLATNGFSVVVEATGLKSMPVFFGHAAIGEFVLMVPSSQAEQARQLLAADVEQPEDEA